MNSRLPKRGTDPMGDGAFGARRGGRTHRGIDYACPPGFEILANESGTVTKLGYPYADDLSYRYVQVTDDLGDAHRYFYVEPVVELHAYVNEGDVIGISQDICARNGYGERGMKNHIHYEIRRNGEFIDPEGSE